MNPNPILVRNISHLTDARYFAAMGVDWMSLPLNHDPASFALWNTIKDWVEGVNLTAELHPADDMLMAKAVIEASPDGIILSQNGESEIPSSVQMFYELHFDDLDRLRSDSYGIISYSPDSLSREQILQLPPDNIFLQAVWTPDMLEAVLSTGYNGGFCFIGGEEEITGVRDYEMMDELLGVLIQ